MTSQYCFGIDVGGTTVKMGLFSIEGELLDNWEIVTRIENEGVHIVPDIAAFILAKVAEKSISREEIVGVGIGVPGPVDDDGIVYKTANTGWGVFNLKKELQDLLNMNVKTGNDANVAALGEMWKGGAQGYHNVVLVTLGTGVGGGIIINGKILTGATGAGGEIGHMHIQDGELEKCGCGNYGCLEQYASATGVVRLANKKLETCDKPSVLRKGEVSAKAIFDAVKSGDALAAEILEEFGEYLGKGLALVGGVCNPEVFVLGGGVSKAGTMLIDYVQKYYKKYVFNGSSEAKFTLATLGNSAGIYGAAKMVL